MNKRFTNLISAIVFALTSLPVNAATLTPTPEQLKIFQQLSPAQQQSILNSAGKKGSGFTQKTITQPVVVKRKSPDTSQEISKQVQEGLDTTTLTEKKESKRVNQKLKQFGYDLFAGAPTTFAPATDIPVPVNYVIGPGDTVEVQLFGKDNEQYSLIVTREGVLNFPGLGPITVAGLSFAELKSNLQQRIKEQMIGVKASISMGTLRSIRIFILGDAERPGSYTVSSLATMTNALFVSGGIKPIGTLRNIQLKRNGKLIKSMDLYDLLLKGDTSGDTRLLPGDVIFIPPIGKTVGVGGEVRRPAIYEIKKENTVGRVITMAGGFLPTAYPQASQLERINKNKERTLIELDLSQKSGKRVKVKTGDVIRVYSILKKMEDIILLTGHVERPGGQQWREGMRLSDIIPGVTSLLPKPDLGYVVIKRETGTERFIKVLTADLKQALAKPGSDADILLQQRDEIMVFSISQNRPKLLSSTITQLQQQATIHNPPEIVQVKGHVVFPGVYPLVKGMTIKQLLNAARGAKPGLDVDYGLLVRKTDLGSKIEVYTFNPAELISADELTSNQLKPEDTVYFFKKGEARTSIDQVVSKLKQQADKTSLAHIVSIGGRVHAPGTYPLESGMRISHLLRAAGRLQESAYVMSAELTRYQIVDGEYRKSSHRAVNLDKVLKGDKAADIVLRPYDHLIIKDIPLWSERENIKIGGEVKFPGTYPIKRGETLSSVIRRAGGVTDLAFIDGAIFMREELQKREQKQMNLLASRLEADIAAASLEATKSEDQSGKSKEALAIGQSLVNQLRATKAAGRLVIDLSRIIASNEDTIALDEVLSDQSGVLLVKNNDVLIIPRKTQSVTVLGEVQYPTSHIYDVSLSRDEYINQSGGITFKADDDRIYIVRANGKVIAGNDSFWSFDNAGAEIKPGDTVIVPLDAERIKSLTLWTSVTRIIYQVGIAIAAFNSAGIF